MSPNAPTEEHQKLSHEMLQKMDHLEPNAQFAVLNEMATRFFTEVPGSFDNRTSSIARMYIAQIGRMLVTHDMAPRDGIPPIALLGMAVAKIGDGMDQEQFSQSLMLVLADVLVQQSDSNESLAEAIKTVAIELKDMAEFRLSTLRQGEIMQ
jgi:hypothetical protein